MKKETPKNYKGLNMYYKGELVYSSTKKDLIELEKAKKCLDIFFDKLTKNENIKPTIYE